MKIKSKRDSNESCKPMFSIGVLNWSYWNYEIQDILF